MIGKILHLSWGYSMTINTFFIVTKETPHTITIEEIGKNDVTGIFLSGHSTPNPNSRTGKVYRAKKKTQKNSGHEYYVSSLDHHRLQYLKEWDGQPKYFNYAD